MRNKNLAIAAMMLAFTGCNTCGSCNTGRPSIFGRLGSCLGGANNVGAPCDAGAGAGAGGAHCDPCTETARYGGYGEHVIGSYETPISGSVGGTLDGVTVGSPVQGLPAGAYVGSPTPATVRAPGEMVRPKPAN